MAVPDGHRESAVRMFEPPWSPAFWSVRSKFDLIGPLGTTRYQVRADRCAGREALTRLEQKLSEIVIGDFPGAAALADHGVASLRGRLHDNTFGGWYAAVDGDGPTAPHKGAYEHAFVVLAAASAVAADRPGADQLLEAALAVQERHFWDDHHGAVVDVWNRDFTRLEDYRGAYGSWYRTWWDYARGFLIDDVDGSWHHELDSHNRPATSVWAGKPAVYHALQATLLPRLPLAPALAPALAAGLLDT
jgi:mannose/cellobiose epimerase-like protein (N-acyl-D-glucosamine 2-epimerase family)